MNGDPWFVDTNVFVYAFDISTSAKQDTALRLLNDHARKIILSTQVLGEFYTSVTRKLQRPLSAERAMDALDELRGFPVRSVHAQLVLSAVRRSQVSRLSYWDALIIESALEAGANVLLTEDLQHGQTFAGMRVVNPFLQHPAAEG